MHMYGTRPAAKGWHTEFSEFLMYDLGFERGNASQCVFEHKERGITTAVYGDDFTSTGTKDQLDWFKQSLETKYELKELARLGPGLRDDKEAKILNRVIRWTDAGLQYEADPRQLEKMLRDLGLDDGVKPVSRSEIECRRRRRGQATER